jgi:hypothetical protein
MLYDTEDSTSSTWFPALPGKMNAKRWLKTTVSSCRDTLQVPLGLHSAIFVNRHMSIHDLTVTQTQSSAVGQFQYQNQLQEVFYSRQTEIQNTTISRTVEEHLPRVTSPPPSHPHLFPSTLSVVVLNLSGRSIP